MNSQSENSESHSIPEKIDLLCDRFELAWRSGTAPDLATYLLGIGELYRPLALRELLRVELELRRARGDSPRLEEYERRYPEYAAILASVIQSAAGSELDNIDTPPRNCGRGRLANELACVDLPLDLGNSSSVVNESPPPETLGDFRIIRKLGSGGMGTVYEAEQLSMGRRVALKVLPFAALVQDKSLQRFRNEVRAAAALDHPHIVSIYSVGEVRGVHFFAMQLIRGQTLADAIARLRNAEPALLRATDASLGSTLRPSGDQRSEQQSLETPPLVDSTDRLSSSRKREQQAPISTPGRSRHNAEFYRTAARLGVQASEALQHAHDLGVLHRDIKPSNLMLDSEVQIYITDFGLARIEADAGVTMTGDIIGTLRYMAPEQALAKRVVIDHRADIYSLGSTLYELLTLQPAFSETDRAELLKKIAFEEPRPLRKLDHRIPVELETIVLKAMAKSPDERYQTSQRLADDLRSFLEHRPIKARPATFADRIRKWSRRHQMVVATAGIALVLLTGLLAVSMALVKRAQTLTVAALEETSDLLYTADMTVAYHTYEKNWSDEVHSILDRHRPSGRKPDRRGMEWHLLQQLVQPPASITLTGHQGAINELAVFPDRRRLASVGEDGTLRIWDVGARRLVREIKICDQELHSLAISPDGSFAVAGNTVVYRCDLEEGDRISELYHSTYTVDSLAFSADGQHLAAGARYDEVCLLSLEGQVEKRIPCASRVESLEYVTGSPLLLVPNRRPETDQQSFGIVQLWGDGLSHIEQELEGALQDRVSNFSIARSSPCGRFVVAGDGYGSSASIFELASGRVIARTPVSRDRLIDIAYSLDGKAIAIGYGNGRIEYFDLQLDADGNPSIDRRPLVVTRHEGVVKSVRFVGAKTLASCGADGLVRIWSMPNDAAQAFDLTDSFMIGLKLSPDGSRLLYACHDVVLIVNMDSGEVVGSHTHPDAGYGESAWSPAGYKVAVCCGYSASVSMLDRSGQALYSIAHETGPEAVAFSPDGSLVAIVGGQRIQICRSDNGQQVFQHSLSQPGTSIAFSQDGTRLACGGRFGAVVIMNVAELEPLRELACSSHASCVVFSPDDSLLATGHQDSVIRLWDVPSGRLRAELIGHERQPNDLAFSPDGHTLLSSASDGALRIWSVDHGRGYGVIYRRFEPGSSEARCRLSLSSDGRRLAAGYGTQRKDCPDVLHWKMEPKIKSASTK